MEKKTTTKPETLRIRLLAGIFLKDDEKTPAGTILELPAKDAIYWVKAGKAEHE